jgi:hypothetical protein
MSVNRPLNPSIEFSSSTEALKYALMAAKASSRKSCLSISSNVCLARYRLTPADVDRPAIAAGADFSWAPAKFLEIARRPLVTSRKALFGFPASRAEGMRDDS